MKNSETGAQRRARERVEKIILLEKKTRAHVEAVQLAARLGDEVAALRESLIESIGKPRKKSAVPETILAAARAVEQGATTAADVARALDITIGCARMRLRRAVVENLVDQIGRGKYGTPGQAPENGAVASILTE